MITMTNQTIKITQKQYVGMWNEAITTSPLLIDFHGVTLGRSKHESGVFYILEIADTQESSHFVINPHEAGYLLTDYIQQLGDDEPTYFLKSIERIKDGQLLVQ